MKVLSSEAYHANKRILVNFVILCAKQYIDRRQDLLEVYEYSLAKLLSATHKLSPSRPLLHVTKFDGINTRALVLKILQSNTDLDEVHRIKSTTLIHNPKLLFTYLNHAKAVNVITPREYQVLLSFVDPQSLYDETQHIHCDDWRWLVEHDFINPV
tara:strand:+ start:78 stop:545 length:468 start_codon:yes stop_codon:yes gene_type:complete